MKTENNSSVTAPLLKDIIDVDKQNQAALPKTENHPEPAADFVHDSGSGYNSNFVFPQD